MIEIKTGMALAAGLGTRMRPLTDDRPKALVELKGRRLLDYALDRFKASGVERAVVNVHHFADDVETHLTHRDAGLAVDISDERGQLLETGGGVVKALPKLGSDPVFISNIDAVWVDGPTPELNRLRRTWDGNRMDALLLLAPMNQVLGFDGTGDFFCKTDGRLTRRGQAPSAPYAYAGVQILNPALMNGQPEEKFSLNRVWDIALEKGRLFGLPMKAFWMHVGDPVALDAAAARLDTRS